MAEERDIEKQLRAAADQRRREAEAPFELHPATRRRLQEEIRRVHPRVVGDTERTSLFANWWFRMAVGAGVAAMVAVIFLPTLSNNKSKSLQLAQNLESRDRAITGSAQNRTASPALESAPAPAPPRRDETDKDRPVATREIARYQDAAKSSTVSVTNNVAPGIATGTATLAFAAPSVQQNFFFRNAGTPADISQTLGDQAADKPAKADLIRSSNDQAKVVAGKIPLATFQMEQTGNQIRITDSDGSVYHGDLTIAQAETPAAAGEEAATAPADAAAREPEKQSGQSGLQKEKLAVNNQAWQPNQNFRFKAAGTNLSLNQRVTISGEFIAATNPVDLLGTTQNGRGGTGGGGGGLVSQSMVNQSQLLSNGRIVGRVVLGNGQEIPLNATPTVP